MIPIVLGIFGALFYFGNSEVRRFENLAARDIRAKISGDKAKVSVKTELNGIIGGPLGDLKKVTIRASNFATDGVPLFTQPELSKKGIIRSLRIELKEFTLGGLKIQELSSTIPDCRFDYTRAVMKRQIRLSQSGIGRGEVLIRERDLEAYILRKFGEIKRVKVTIADDLVRVVGYGEFIIVKADFQLEAKLAAVEGSKLSLIDARIRFDGKPADEISSKALLETLNPVVDLNQDLKLHNAILVDEILLRNGILRASGTTRIPIQPGEPAEPPVNWYWLRGFAFR